MGSYKLKFKSAVEKDLETLPKNLYARFVARLEALKSDPFPPQAILLQTTERLYRLRVGDYRIVYEVDTDTSVVTVHYVRHRREVYRRLR